MRVIFFQLWKFVEEPKFGLELRTTIELEYNLVNSKFSCIQRWKQLVHIDDVLQVVNSVLLSDLSNLIVSYVDEDLILHAIGYTIRVRVDLI